MLFVSGRVVSRISGFSGIMDIYMCTSIRGKDKPCEDLWAYYAKGEPRYESTVFRREWMYGREVNICV